MKIAVKQNDENSSLCFIEFNNGRIFLKGMMGALAPLVV
jgi:hypothetical protein